MTTIRVRPEQTDWPDWLDWLKKPLTFPPPPADHQDVRSCDGNHKSTTTTPQDKPTDRANMPSYEPENLNISKVINHEDGTPSLPIILYRNHYSVLYPTHEVEHEHKFGGKCPFKIKARRTASIHHIATLRLMRDWPQIEQMPAELPLLYPFRHDEGTMAYTFDGSVARVTQLHPRKPTKGWPYEDYPKTFPEVKFAATEPTKLSEQDVEDHLWGVPHFEEEEMLILIPPSNAYGVSMWGTDGDLEGVLCVFHYEPTSGVVRAEAE